MNIVNFDSVLMVLFAKFFFNRAVGVTCRSGADATANAGVAASARLIDRKILIRITFLFFLFAFDFANIHRDGLGKLTVSAEGIVLVLRSAGNGGVVGTALACLIARERHFTHLRA